MEAKYIKTYIISALMAKLQEYINQDKNMFWRCHEGVEINTPEDARNIQQAYLSNAVAINLIPYYTTINYQLEFSDNNCLFENNLGNFTIPTIEIPNYIVKFKRIDYKERKEIKEDSRYLLLQNMVLEAQEQKRLNMFSKLNYSDNELDILKCCNVF
jgi:hypothetical protein